MRDGALLKADVFRPYGDGKYPAILNLGPYQKDKLWLVPDTLGEKRNEWMNWETVNPQWWVPRGYAAVRVDGRGTGKSPRPMRAVVICRGGRFLRRHRMGGGAAVVQRQCRAARHFLFRHQSMVRRQSCAALAEGRSFRGRVLPIIYRDALYHGGILNLFMTNWFTAHLLHHMLGRASQHQPDGWQVNTLHFWLRNNLDSGAFARRAGAMGQDQGADVLGRQLVGHGAASARQYRSLHARGDAAQEAAHPSRLACASVLYRGGPAGSDPLLRLLAQRHRQRRDGRAAGQACRSARAAMRSNGATSTNGRSSARAGPSSISICRRRRQRHPQARRSPARWK